MSEPKPVRIGTRVVLVAGFGAVLALMAAAAADSLRVLAETQARNAAVHREFLAKERTLDDIRAALHLSGNVVRDYLLLHPGRVTAQDLRGELKALRDEMESALKTYARSLRPDEQVPFLHLSNEVDRYWLVLNPVFEWDSEQKSEQSYWFLRTELFPRRTTVLDITREIAAVNEKTLQDGEIRVAEVFERFRRRLRIISGLAVGFGLLVATISIVYILRLERNLHDRYRESIHAQGKLKELSARLVEAQELERRAISRELHDEVGQSMSALLVEVGGLLAAADDGPWRRRLESIKKLAEGSVGAVRNMCLLLRPSMLDDLGLVPALEWQGREVAKRTGLRVEVVEENVADSLPEEHRTCVYRVVQEALHNCARHAEANFARIVVRQETERLLLTIQDDGKGFDAHRVRGLGLLGMAERVEHLGGAFQVESGPGRGTVLKVELPVATEAA